MNNLSINQLLSLKGKTAVITGAAVGIGYAIAERLHEAGANVVLVDTNHDSVLESTAKLNYKRPNSSFAVHANVTIAEDVKRAINASIVNFNSVDILVNNAGIFPTALIADMTVQDFHSVIDTNLTGVFLFTKYVAEQMKKQGTGGKIINITSIDSIRPSMVGLAHYDASKHGVLGFTKNIALELADNNIWVNAIAPGGIMTPGVIAGFSSISETDNSNDNLSALDTFTAKIPMHRMGDPDDIARVALFLASDMSSYMTGSQIIVDGGALLI